MVGACGGGGSAGIPDAAPDAPLAVDARPPDAAPLPDATPPIDSAPRPDARPADLSCADQDGGTVPATITIMGRLRQGLLNPSNSAEVSIDFFPPDEMPPAIASTKTGSDGRFTLQLVTELKPVDGVGRFTKNGFINEWFYPGQPLARSYAGLEGLMGRTSDLDNPLIGLVFGTSFDATKGLAAILVLDCNNTPIEGATITLDPPAEKMIYADSTALPSPLLTETSRAGAVYGWNMPVGSITITGQVGGKPLHGHVFKTHMGEISLTLLTP